MATKRKKKQSGEWIINEDQFHPDPAIAARTANKDAAKVGAEKLQEEISRQKRRIDRAAGNVERKREREALKRMEANLQLVNKKIAEYDKEEKK